MLNFPLGLDAKLHRVAISSSDNADPLDIFDWECFDALLLVSNQTKAANATAIGEGDMPAIWIKLPTCLFVLHASVVALKLWVSFLSGLVVLAIVIEAGDGKIRTIGTGLMSLGVESGGERIFFSKNSAIGLQVVFGDIIAVH